MFMQKKIVLNKILDLFILGQKQSDLGLDFIINVCFIRICFSSGSCDCHIKKLKFLHPPMIICGVRTEQNLYKITFYLLYYDFQLVYLR